MAASSPITSRGLSAGNPHAFDETRPAHGPGRPQGSRTQVGNDLMQLVLMAAENLGFMKKNPKTGEWFATGERGVLGYLEWVGSHRPERLVAMMTHGIPKQVHATMTHRAATRTVEEIDAELRERGLPVELLEHLRMMPDVLQEGEDPDYGLLKDVTPDVAQDDEAPK
jgi:hypothetical protein